jgi:type I restriction enzyme S subunit
VGLTKLGEIISLQRGYDLTEPQRRPGRVPIVGSAGVHGFHDTAKACGPGVTLGRSGASFGRVTYVREDYWPHNTTIFVTDFKGNNPLFVRYLLESLDFSSLNSGSAQQSLNRNYVYTVEVPRFPLPIQRRIAGILSAYDDLIENSQRRIKILEEMARRLYREWFVYFRFPGHEGCRLVQSPLGEIPEGWEVKKLGDLADISWGDTSTTKASYVAEGYVAYSASGLDGKLDHYDFDRTGIVLSAIGAQCGRTWLARGKWSCIKNTIRFWSKNASASNEFLFVSTEGQGFWPRRGAAQPFISQGDAERIDIVIPEHATMQRFTNFASDSLEQIAILQEQVHKLRRTRDLLLPRLLSGQVNVEALPEPVLSEA